MAYTTDTGRVAAGPAFGPIETIGLAIANAVRRARRSRECVRAEVQLNAMNDRTLADIGIDRSQIHDRVWGRH